MEELLSRLKESGHTFSIAEVGCGLPVAHSFMMLDGASKAIKLAISPYSKDVQDVLTREYYYRAKRSVSREQVLALLEYLDDVSDSVFSVAYSVQIGVDKCSHGYIGVSRGDIKTIYHFTFGYGINKITAAKLLIEIAKKVIYRVVYDQEIEWGVSVFDGVWRYSDGDHIFAPWMLPRNFATFAIVKGEWARYTEILRSNPRSNLSVGFIKGSFNPVHQGHIQMATKATSLGIKPIFSLTTKTFDGKETSLETLIRRAADISMQYDCVIDSDNMMMKDLIRDFEHHADPDYPIYVHLFMGVDVFSKFDINDVSSAVEVHVFFRETSINNITFHQGEYSTLSSTQLREQQNEISNPPAEGSAN